MSWPLLFLIFLGLSLGSGLCILHPQVPLRFIRIHIGMLALAPIAALLGLIFSKGDYFLGVLHFDSLSWLWSLFVLTIGLIVQRYCVHYLLGDKSYRKYFALLTITTSADALAWLSDDVRLLFIGWGLTLFCLTVLIGLRKEWKVAQHAAKVSRGYLLASLLALGLALFWLAYSTGEWRLSTILTPDTLGLLSGYEKTGINLLLLVSALIPAAQWPTHRWLLDSVVTPTPISAVMHAGIVNAGSIMLARFSPLFNGDLAQIILLVMAGLSVLIGTGIMLVQVDYKRQLVGSTIAQMGFMLVQCALGAYLAAITHAVLHGLFKSTLFLQAGSAAKAKAPVTSKDQAASVIWTVAGGALGTLIGLGLWLTAKGEGYQLISALLLGWSIALAWAQLVAAHPTATGKIAGFFLLVVGGLVFKVVHTLFYNILQGTIDSDFHQPFILSIIVLVVLLAAIVCGTWLIRRNNKVSFALYLWLVRLGEPKKRLAESHPNYLAQLLTKEGNYQ